MRKQSAPVSPGRLEGWSQPAEKARPRGDSAGSASRAPDDDGALIQEKLEDERLSRQADMQEARDRAAAERETEPAVPRLFFWSAELVASNLQQLGLPECAAHVLRAKLEGRRFINLEDSGLGGLLEPIARDTKAVRKANAYFLGVRRDELANAPKLTALITTKIDGSKRTCNLNLNEMKLTSFPDVICDILPLVNISAVHNRIRSVPGEIGLLTRLANLKLGQNKIISLPDSIGRCKALQMLMVEENELKHLPRALGNCVSLRVLDVSRNNLKMLPSTLSKCHKIVKLVAFDNPLKLPREVMDEGTKAVVSLLESIGDAEDGDYLRMVGIKLHAIPEFTFDMTSLTMLNLDHNRSLAPC